MLKKLYSAIEEFRGENGFFNHVLHLFYQFEQIYIKQIKCGIYISVCSDMEFANDKTFKNEDVYWCGWCNRYSRKKCHYAEKTPLFLSLFPFSTLKGIGNDWCESTLFLPEKVSESYINIVKMQKTNCTVITKQFLKHFGEGLDLHKKSEQFKLTFRKFVTELKLHECCFTPRVYRECGNNYPKFKAFLFNQMVNDSAELRSLELR